MRDAPLFLRATSGTCFRGCLLFALSLTTDRLIVAAPDRPLQPSIGWTAPLNGSLSSPVAVGGALYVGSRDGVLYSFDTATGKLRWHFQTGVGLPSGLSGIVIPREASLGEQLAAAAAASDNGLAEIRATPLVSSGTVVVKSEDGLLYALDAGTGEKRWAAPASFWGTPFVADAVLYLVTIQSGQLTPLSAIDLISGKERWRFDAKLLEGVDTERDHVYVTGRAGEASEKPQIYSLDPATGGVVWKTALERADVTRPLCAPAAVYVATSDREVPKNPASTLYAIERDSGRALWKSEARGRRGFDSIAAYLARDRVFFATLGEVRSLDPKTGETRWSFGVYEVQQVVLDDRAVYVGSLNNLGRRTIDALNQENGRRLWTKSLGKGYGRIHGIHDGLLVFDTDTRVGKRETSTLHAVDVATGKERWNHALPTSVSARGVFADGFLFVPTTPDRESPTTSKPGSLFAIDPGSGTFKP